MTGVWKDSMELGYNRKENTAGIRLMTEYRRGIFTAAHNLPVRWRYSVGEMPASFLKAVGK